MSSESIDFSMVSRLLQEIQKLKDEAKDSTEALNTQNSKLLKENEKLKEEKNIQEELAKKFKIYATLLESMLDNAREEQNTESSQVNDPTLEEMRETVNRLQREKDDLNDMMDEFKAMWKKDSKDFLETLKIVRKEEADMKAKFDRQEQRHIRDQGLIHEAYGKMQLVENARRITLDANVHMEQELRRNVAEVDVCKKQIEELSKEKAALDSKLKQQESWMQTQSAELSTALAEMFKSREIAARQIKDLKENYQLLQNSHAQELAAVKKQKEEDKEYFENEKAYLSDRMNKAIYEVEVLQNKATWLEASLKTTTENSAEATRKFLAIEKDLNEQLKEIEERLEKKSREYEEACDDVKRSKSVISECQVNFASTHNALALKHLKLEEKEAEMSQIREQLGATLRNCLDEKEKLEQKHQDTIAAVQQRFVYQIEEIKHNNMLAINQEMIKAQMALDSEKKKNALENDANQKKMEKMAAEIERAQRELRASTAKINVLTKDVISLSNDNDRIETECAHLKDDQVINRTKISSLKTYIGKLETAAFEAEEKHQSEMNELRDATRSLMENMGVEELDECNDNDSTVVTQEKTESAEWELVDEE
ncbi:Protein CBR-EPG-2 [Caenorhabditis briggsae]|uniref:Protein CBR-EPG-2 n=3 Tax=Caenorhabditis briggsae TaxID=6238 RepID=A8WWZ5_CAEBR|nr:Protein CBR-EPG-2 [Caenorhabditis briggsae]ULU10755.1 hypothetical protein L3Y34_014776 [Caenorhabditis briggsae]CAP24694.1 Protein CBR-EPG-2 [Caenorhabditis briggsae]